MQMPVQTTPGSRADGAEAAAVERPRFLVATDGSLAADVAITTTGALASRDGAELALLTVVPAPAGRVGKQIARAARDRGCRMIVLGMSEHDAIDRALGHETALQVIRHADVPVLAASAHSPALPSRVMVAVDLGDASVRTAYAALEVLGDAGTLYLVHVAPRIPIPFAGSRTWEVPAGNELHPPFDVLLRDLIAPRTVRFECVTLCGDPASELLRFAEANQMDLIAAGAHRRAPFVKTILGGVATKLFRGARCSVLMVPPPVAPRSQTEADAPV